MQIMNDNEKVTEYKNFNDFYPFYLSQHQTLMCRRLHFAGTALVCLSVLMFLFTFSWFWFILIPITGYGFAWVGHYVYEKNKPATFLYPLYSLMGDFVMFWQILIGKLKV